MPFKRLICAIFIILITILSAVPVSACTIFTTKLEDGTFIAGNNEDWMYTIPNSMILYAPSQDRLGSVCFYNASYVQGGMNEYGLFYDGASCPSSTVPYDSNKESLDYDLGKLILSKCKTVKEVETFLKQYNIPKSFCDHLLFADATGDSAVFEWVKDELYIIRKENTEDYQVITNFWLTDPKLGNYPCARYDAALKFLQVGTPFLEDCVQILESCKQNWGDGGTLYSSIYDLSNKEVYVYLRGDLSAPYKFNLLQELQSIAPGSEKSFTFDELNFTPLSNTAPFQEQISPQSTALHTNELETQNQASTAAQPNTENSHPFVKFVLPLSLLSILVVLIMIYIMNKNKSKFN